MKLRRHFVLAALAVVLLLAGTVFTRRCSAPAEKSSIRTITRKVRRRKKGHSPKAGLKSATTST